MQQVLPICQPDSVPQIEHSMEYHLGMGVHYYLGSLWDDSVVYMLLYNGLILAKDLHGQLGV